MAKDYNSKMERLLENFIIQRIEGKSYDEIAASLKVAKSTLIEWNKTKSTRDQISEGKALKINSIVNAYNFSLQSRLTTYLKISQKIHNELLERDLKDLGTETLLKMSISNDTRVKELFEKSIMIGEYTSKYTIRDTDQPDGYFYIDSDS